MWLINGEKAGPTLVVTAGVHAAEYASIAAVLDLGRNLGPDNLRGRVVVVPVLNVAGFGGFILLSAPSRKKGQATGLHPYSETRESGTGK
ncbi:MAG: succinylglutamate desuccinylase/aspartoacylase family protein [Acidobacteriia bacterium]|nr:succinylglutamate desuccinylase/aspartoacylase family protein [Terriglobia bacterium]